MSKVAIATCVTLPEPDVDEALLRAALERAGAQVRMLAWDDPNPNAYAEEDELVVVRSTWNYFEQIDRFLAWADRTSAVTRLLNPVAIIRGNAHKTYLRDLGGAGIDVVPTAYVMRDESKSNSIAAITDARGWKEIVIKPTVSAGSFLTKRFDVMTENARVDAQRFLDELTQEQNRDVMIQRWMPSVDTHGERSLVWIDGQLTHAIRKAPRFAGGQERVSASDVPIADEERTFALRVIEQAMLTSRGDGDGGGGGGGSDLLYARVDMVKDEEDVLRLMELEMIEPSLFLKQCPAALDRLVSAIMKRYRGRTRA